MKQFTQCEQCQQWYTPTVTMPVDIQRGLAGHHTALWCYRCILEAEQRSTTLSQTLSTLPEYDAELPEDALEDADPPSRLAYPSFSDPALPGATGPADDFQRCLQEHLALMGRALHEDDTILGMTVETFLQRCRALQERLAIPEQTQRLQGCIHYWETFVRALNQGAG